MSTPKSPIHGLASSMHAHASVLRALTEELFDALGPDNDSPIDVGKLQRTVHEMETAMQAIRVAEYTLRAHFQKPLNGKPGK